MLLTKLKNNKNLQFFICFGGILFLDAYLSHLQMDQWRYLSKPIIMISLLGYFVAHKKSMSKKIFLWGALAMIFSLAGDVFLMFNSEIPAFFIVGLGSFLIAHLFYITIFIKQRNKNLPFKWGSLARLVFYAWLMGYLIVDKTGDLLVPVMVYIAVITAMAFVSLLRKGVVLTNSYASGVIGARLFLASDSLLALSMFTDKLPEVSFLIMGTYGLAQALIAYSLVHSEKVSLSNKKL